MSTEFDISGHAASALTRADAVTKTLPAVIQPPHGSTAAGKAEAAPVDRIGAATPPLFAPLLAALLDLAACRVELRRVLRGEHPSIGGRS